MSNTQSMMATRQEGFWSSREETWLPMPQAYAGPWDAKELFLERLKMIEERAHSQGYRGFSSCRICSRLNGSATFSYGVWEWPSGYGHYIENHNIRPSVEFEKFILGKHYGTRF